MVETVRTGPVGFTIVAELGASRQITVGGNFPVDADEAEINKTLDPLIAAINRQQAKTAVINLDGEIESMERSLRMQKQDIERIDAMQAGKQISKVEQQQRMAAVQNVGRLEDDIQAKKKARAEFAKQAE